MNFIPDNPLWLENSRSAIVNRAEPVDQLYDPTQFPVWVAVFAAVCMSSPIIALLRQVLGIYPKSRKQP